MQNLTFSRLSRPRQVLIRLCQRINHGCLMNVQVHDGEVCFDAATGANIDLRLDIDVPQRPELELVDFALSAEHCRLLEQIESLKNGLIDKTVVHDGIPRRAVLHRVFPEITQ